MMIIKYLEVWIIRTFIIKACGILIVEVQLEMNLIEVEISEFNVNVINYSLWYVDIYI